MISIMARIMFALVISIGVVVPKAAAQSDKYSKMAPVDQYLMERNAEVLLARSAAPDSISSDATILVLGRQGYETAVRGKNGFVCMVERSWMAPFDSPEFWNPKVRGAECLNRQATERPHPCIKSRLTTTQSRHPTQLRLGNPSGLPSELSAAHSLRHKRTYGNKKSQHT
jgi:hypothetical protein